VHVLEDRLVCLCTWPIKDASKRLAVAEGQAGKGAELGFAAARDFPL
jgi:hypothetical protein